MNKNTPKQHWSSQKERGSTFFLNLLIFFTRLLGRRAGRLLLVAITSYYLLTGKSARLASKRYLRRILGKEPSIKDSFKHFYYFAATSLDRLLLLQGQNKHFQIKAHGQEVFDELTAKKQGCILLVSHIGSFDVMRIPGIREQELPIKILMDKHHNSMAMQLITKLDPELASKILDTNQFMPELILSMQESIQQGYMIGIMADRLRQGETGVECQLLSDTVQLPSSPWLLAQTLKVPVVLCFGLYQGKNIYHIYFEKGKQTIANSRKERTTAMSQSAQEYCRRIEYYLSLQPYNWFNFYDFWNDEAASH